MLKSKLYCIERSIPNFLLNERLSNQITSTISQAFESTITPNEYIIKSILKVYHLWFLICSHSVSLYDHKRENLVMQMLEVYGKLSATLPKAKPTLTKCLCYIKLACNGNQLLEALLLKHIPSVKMDEKDNQINKADLYKKSDKITRYQISQITKYSLIYLPMLCQNSNCRKQLSFYDYLGNMENVSNSVHSICPHCKELYMPELRIELPDKRIERCALLAPEYLLNRVYDIIKYSGLICLFTEDLFIRSRQIFWNLLLYFRLLNLSYSPLSLKFEIYRNWNMSEHHINWEKDDAKNEGSMIVLPSLEECTANLLSYYEKQYVHMNKYIETKLKKSLKSKKRMMMSIQYLGEQSLIKKDASNPMI